MKCQSLNLMVKVTFFACLFSVPALAETKALLPMETRELLENGRVLSSATVSGTDVATLGGIGPKMRSAPTDTRIHEAFVYYRGEVYLCHFVGAKGGSTPPYASCYGYW
jgi:hypothetical protein